MEQRLAKVRERRGLPPPAAPAPETIPLPEESTIAKAIATNAAEIARLEREMHEVNEKEADRKRKAYVRPWDKDKNERELIRGTSLLHCFQSTNRNG